MLKAPSHDWRIDACLPACLPGWLAGWLPACLLVGTSTGSWTKRELPLASSLSQLSAPRRAERASAKGIEYPVVFYHPPFPFIPFLSLLPFPLVSLVALSPGTGPKKKNLEDSGYADSLGVPYLANKPRDSRCVRRAPWGGRKDACPRVLSLLQYFF